MEKKGRKGNLIVVLIEHDNDLGHVVELRDGAEVIHSSLPLRILLLLSHTTQETKHMEAHFYARRSLAPLILYLRPANLHSGKC